MAMMIIDDDCFIKELNKFNENNELIKTDELKEIKEPEIVSSLDLIGKIVDIQRGRGAKRLEVPNSLRQIIAEESINGTSSKELSDKFGVSESSISAYKHDSTSTASYDKPNEELKKSNDVIREGISDRARSKLMDALDHITSDKMAEAKLRDIASVAQSMSGIIKNLEPTVQVNQQNNQVIVYKPRMRDEDEFDVITVNE